MRRAHEKSSRPAAISTARKEGRHARVDAPHACGSNTCAGMATLEVRRAGRTRARWLPQPALASSTNGASEMRHRQRCAAPAASAHSERSSPGVHRAVRGERCACECAKLCARKQRRRAMPERGQTHFSTRNCRRAGGDHVQGRREAAADWSARFQSPVDLCRRSGRGTGEVVGLGGECPGHDDRRFDRISSPPERRHLRPCFCNAASAIGGTAAPGLRNHSHSIVPGGLLV